MKLTCTVFSQKEQYIFQFLVRITNAPEQLHLHPTEFYEKWGKVIPEGIHHELEIVAPENKFFEKHKLHIERSRFTQKPFICYPSPLPKLDKVITVVQAWSLGSVATITEGVDLNTILQDCGNDLTKIEGAVKVRFKITTKPLYLSGPILYSLSLNDIINHKNMPSPWQYSGYYTIELATRCPEHLIAADLEREENIVVVKAGMIEGRGSYITFGGGIKNFDLHHRWVKNVRRDDGSLIWLNPGVSQGG